MIVAIDVSGNFKEGLGTSGIALSLDNETVHKVTELYAGKFLSAEEYWDKHLDYLRELNKDGKLEVVMEGFRLYETKRNQQTHSVFETPMLIGIIRLWCYQNNVPLKIQYANEVKTRWSDRVLTSSGHIHLKGTFRYCSATNTPLNNHKTDAIRHLLHYLHYGRKKA